MAGGREPKFFRRVAVLGIGLMGSSFALALKKAGLVGEVIGVARRQNTLEAAAEVGAADRITTDPAEAAAEADLVYLAAPVAANVRLLQVVAPALPPGCLVTDAGSVKGDLVAVAERELGGQVSFVGGHPMAGSEQSGPAAARADLFVGHTYFLVPTALGGQEALASMRAVVEAIGGMPLVIDAATHDRLVAVTSHLPHAVAAAVMLAVSELVEDPQLRARGSGGGLRDTTRIAAGPAEVWRDIFLANADALAEACQSTCRWLEELAEAAKEGQGDRLVKLLEEARRQREVLSQQGEGEAE